MGRSHRHSGVASSLVSEPVQHLLAGRHTAWCQSSLSGAQPPCRKALSRLPEEARLGDLGNHGALLMSAGRLSDSLEVIEDSILVGEKYSHEDTHQVGPASVLPPVTRRTSQNNMSIKRNKQATRPPCQCPGQALA